MNDIAQLLPVIQSLEVQLHQSATRNDANLVGELLHDDFEEIGCSGLRYDRQQTIAALKLESGQPQIFAQEFKLVKLADGAVLLRYKSFQRDADGSIRSGCNRHKRAEAIGRCVFIKEHRSRIEADCVSTRTITTHEPTSRKPSNQSVKVR
ncbi:nuclear transport factor 2 family protein [Serratia fonticola]|uniref:nuclear transport factor 2 family protein n=1 Tax=Serratia fonticola TaxID=47917 RepID=UPI00301BA2A0